MKRKTMVLLTAALAAVLMLSACGTKSLTGAPQNENTASNSAGVSDPTPANTESGNNAANPDEGTATNGDPAETTGNQADENGAANGDILIVID